MTSSTPSIELTRRVIVSWDVGAKAFAASRIRPLGAALDREGVVQLKIALSRDNTAVVTVSTRGGVELLRETHRVTFRMSIDADRELVHVDAGELCTASFPLLSSGAGPVSYAATSVISRLGIVGGRYRPSGVKLESMELAEAFGRPRATWAAARPVKKGPGYHARPPAPSR